MRTSKPSTGRLASAARTASSLAPASRSAATAMSPLMPDEHSRYSIFPMFRFPFLSEHAPAKLANKCFT